MIWKLLDYLMKNNLIHEYGNYDTIKQFDSLPGRIFLDTNVLEKGDAPLIFSKRKLKLSLDVFS